VQEQGWKGACAGHVGNVAFPKVPRVPVILVALLLACALARAQESAPATIDASPTAAELLRRAEEMASANPGESARLVQEAVDRFAGRLVPWPPEPDRWRSAAAAAEELLRANPEVRARWLQREGPVAERALEEGRWLDAVQLRAVSPAALQAMLRLAQLAMDEGRLLDARLWMERALRHADLDAATRSRIEAALEAVRARVSPAASRPALASGTIDDWQPLWGLDNPSSWMARRITDQDPVTARRNLDAQVRDGSALAAVPRFDGDAVLLADGTSAQAIERFSGSPIWRSVIGTLSDAPMQPLEDLTVAEPAGDVVLTLPGHALPDQRSGTPRVTAIDRATGFKIWEASLESFERPEFADLFPHGTPFRVGDLAIVQARKSNSRLESAAWILAFEVRTGRLRWAVPIAAAGGVRLAASRPLGSPSAVGDDVFVASSLGAVARLDGATGETRWLRRWPAPIREPRSAYPAWQLPSPVADAGLVAWLAPDAATLVVLDPADGRTRSSVAVGPDTPIGLARSLLLDDERLYTLGDDVVALDRQDPRRVLWRLSQRLAGVDARPRGAATLGTLADGSSALAVPLADRVVLLSPVDGAVLGSSAGSGGGNLALRDGQLAVAGAITLSLLMPADAGERVLRERLAADPDDPRRGLALVELGRSWKRPGLVLDGAVAAAAAIAAIPAEDGGEVRDAIVTRLLEPATLTDLDRVQANRVVELADSSARTPPQRARVRLARAARAMADGRPSFAVDAWRAIASDPGMAAALLRTDGQREIAAGVLARQALAGSGDAAAIAWERSMRAEMSPEPVPSVGLLTTDTIWIEGSLIPEDRLARLQRPLDAVLTQRRSALVMHRGPKLASAWSVPLESREVRILAWLPRLVVWVPVDAREGSLLLIDPDKGRVATRVDRVSTLFDSIEMPQGTTARDRNELLHVDAWVAGQRAVLMRGDGQWLGLDLSGDGTPAWRARAPVARVAGLDHDGDAAVVMGPAGGDSDGAVIAVLSSIDGSVTHRVPWPTALGVPRWVKLVPSGVVAAGSDAVAALDLAPGLPMRWMQGDPRARALDAERLAGSWLLLTDGQRRLSALRLADGELVADFLRVTEATDMSAVNLVERTAAGWLVHRLNGLTLHGDDGSFEGQAVSATGRRHDQIALCVEGVLTAEIVQPDGARPALPGQTISLRRLRLDQGLRSVDRPVVLQVEGLGLAGADAVQGWLLLGGDDRTLAVAGHAGIAEPR
jgi:outer membrane protein assembly factor BamB